MLSAIIVSAAISLSPLPENQITYITPDLYAPTHERIGFDLNEESHAWVAGTIPQDESTDNQWSQRAQLGGEDAAEWIVVRYRDGLFAIDPFTPLPQGDQVTMRAARQLFKPMKYGTDGAVVTLDTDHSLFNRDRINRTRELFRVLEVQRVQWLRANGFYGVRTLSGNPAPMNQQTRAGDRLEQRPADMPRTKPIESVQAPSVVHPILAGDEPIRIHLPDLGTTKEMRDRVAARDGVIKNAPEDAAHTELAKNDASPTEPANP